MNEQEGAVADTPLFYSLKILFEPLSQATVIAPEFGVTGRPVAVSIRAIRLDVESFPVSLKIAMKSQRMPVTAEKVTSAASQIPEVGSIIVSCGQSVRTLLPELPMKLVPRWVRYWCVAL